MGITVPYKIYFTIFRYSQPVYNLFFEQFPQISARTGTFSNKMFILDAIRSTL
ncbi:hypothetical protein SB48_HM08orf00061 [Heyndrickxia coagulans]|uniref:Uncharacterized protein n=1 Tax=Heyndrickxia coagulans TaxID=1398 RepID=A0AAN0WA84_HEYCO|nr:hypothetical protein SB48_HM08orf00061 [Heyndrickxia coagulans]KYC61105.1 hypothetical protein B4100_1437 [Heyndrickxia coagulans]